MPQRLIPDQENWDAWHPEELARRLADVARPWCVVGGWALDLWHGTKTREHGDLEFSILRQDISQFRKSLIGLEFYTVSDGVFTPLADGESVPPSIFQIWCYDPKAERWCVDMMIEPGTPETWAYKRDPSITTPRAEITEIAPTGVPYLNPAAILLFKAKHLRAKDQADFNLAMPKLAPEERAWLRNCLEHLHPGHVWLEKL